jgi:phospholipase C
MKAIVLTFACIGILLASSMVLVSSPAEAYKTSDHPLLVDFALEVLDADGYTYLASYLGDSGNLKKIKQGIQDCDRTDLAVNHYYNPATGAGLAGATPATELASQFWYKAVSAYVEGDPGTAWYYFGWALHPVQDLFIPFHSNLDPVNGHTAYESFADQYRFFFNLPSHGTYGVSNNASDWVHYAANASYSYYPSVSGVNATDSNFDLALTALWPKTVALTAGYIKAFGDALSLGDFKVYKLKTGIDYVQIGWDEVPGANFTEYQIYLSTDEDHIVDGDPYATVQDRTTTEKKISQLDLGTDYYVRVRALCNGTVSQSNLLKVTPHYATIFFIVPAVTGLVCLFILLSKKHRPHRKVMR